MIEEKRCSKCHAVKPNTIEYFERYREKLRSTCRECRRAERKQWYLDNREQALEKAKQYAEKNREQRLKKKKEYRDANKDKIAEYMKVYRAENHEKIAKKNAEWYRSNIKHAREQCRRYHAENKPRLNARSRNWHKVNPEKSKALCISYRGRKLTATGSSSPEDIATIRMLQENRCHYCGVDLTAVQEPHLDHFIPLSRGGSNNPDNLVWACPTCNISKGNRMPWEWRKWNGASPVLSNANQ